MARRITRIRIVIGLGGKNLPSRLGEKDRRTAKRCLSSGQCLRIRSCKGSEISINKSALDVAKVLIFGEKDAHLLIDRCVPVD